MKHTEPHREGNPFAMIRNAIVYSIAIYLGAIIILGVTAHASERWPYGVEPPPSWFTGKLSVEPTYIRVSWKDVGKVCSSAGLSRLDGDQACTFWVGTIAMVVLPNDVDPDEIAAHDLHERFHANGYCHPSGKLFGWVYCGVPAQKRES